MSNGISGAFINCYVFNFWNIVVDLGLVAGLLYYFDSIEFYSEFRVFLE